MSKETKKLSKKELEAKKDKETKILATVGIAIAALAVIAIVAAIIGALVTGSKSEDADAAEEVTTEAVETETTEADASQAEIMGYNDDTSLVVEDGHLVNIDYTGYVDGVAFDGGSTNGMGADLEIGSHSYIDDFEEQLIGHNVGDNVQVEVTFPENYGAEELAGKDATFDVTINGIY